MAGASGQRMVELLCRADQRPGSSRFREASFVDLAQNLARAVTEGSDHDSRGRTSRGPVLASRKGPASLANRAICRQPPKVGSGRRERHPSRGVDRGRGDGRERGRRSGGTQRRDSHGQLRHGPRVGRRSGGTPVKAIHFLELRARVDALRTRAGLPVFGRTGPTLIPGVTPIGRVHLTELRSALAAAYAVAGRPEFLVATPCGPPGRRVKWRREWDSNPR